MIVINITGLQLGATGLNPNVNYNSDIYKLIKDKTGHTSNDLSNYHYLHFIPATNKFTLHKRQTTTNSPDHVVTTPNSLKHLITQLSFGHPVWKYAVNDIIQHKSTKLIAKITHQALTDNKKYPAYKVKLDGTGKHTKWSETKVEIVSTDKPLIKPFHIDISEAFDNSFRTRLEIREKFKEIKHHNIDWSDKTGKEYCQYNPSTHAFSFHETNPVSTRLKNVQQFIDKVKNYQHVSFAPDKPSVNTAGPYTTQMSVQLISLEEARQTTDWFLSADVPKGWGLDNDNSRKMFNTTQPISRNSETVCWIRVDGIEREVHRSFIKDILHPAEILYTERDDLTRYIKKGDVVKIHSKDYFERNAGLTPNGNPKGLKISWDSDEKMQTLYGKRAQVHTINTNAIKIKIKDSIWTYSYDTFVHIFVKPTESSSTDHWSSETETTPDDPEISSVILDDITESVPEPKPKPKSTITEMSAEEEIEMIFPMQVLLEGPVGSGKTTMLMNLAEKLGLRYFAMVMTDNTTAADFKGYKNVVDGKYVGPEFRDAFENGGMYVLEELNATTSNMPIIFNTIENGYFVFADKLVYAHKDFRLCATMNTITNAKDFGGRRTLDKSVDNRFHKIMLYTDYAARYPTDLIWLQGEINFIIKAEGSTKELTPRDLNRYLQFVDNGLDELTAARKALDPTKFIKDKALADLIERKKGK